MLKLGFKIITMFKVTALAAMSQIQNGGGDKLSTSLFTSSNHNKLKLGLG